MQVQVQVQVQGAKPSAERLWRWEMGGEYYVNEERTVQDIAQDFRELLTASREGLLSTHSLKHPGYPFGSFVPFAVTPEGEVVFQMSPLAEHFRNLEANPKSSLCISQRAEGTDRDRARATLLLDVTPVPRENEESYRAAWEAATARDIPADVAATFRFMRGMLQMVRWIGGFGEARWLRPEQLRS